MPSKAIHQQLDQALAQTGAQAPAAFIWGLFTAVGSSPTMRMPNEWLEIVIGESRLEDEAQAQQLVGALMGAYNAALEDLDDPSAKIGPDVENEVAVAQWCRGYVIGARLDPEWVNDETAHMRLFPFGVLSDLVKLESADPEELAKIAANRPEWTANLSAAVREFHDYWADRRRSAAVEAAAAMRARGKMPGPTSDRVPEPIRRDGPKIGRNAPCPCGSGKKYKRCCGTH